MNQIIAVETGFSKRIYYLWEKGQYTTFQTFFLKKKSTIINNHYINYLTA